MFLGEYLRHATWMLKITHKVADQKLTIVW